MRLKYEPGDDVIPKIEERDKTLRERRLEDEDRRLVNQVQAASLREVNVETPEERRERRRRREERARTSAGRSSRDERGSRDDRHTSRETSRERPVPVRPSRRRDTGESSGGEGRNRRRVAASEPGPPNLHPDPEANERRRRRLAEQAARGSSRQAEIQRRNEEADRTAVRQLEHQSSLRSLISSSEVDSHEMEEEILRQIREEGLLDGIDLENINVAQEDQISERIAEAFRRRQRERSPAVAPSRTRERSASDRTDRDRRYASSNRVSPNNATQYPPIAGESRRYHSRSLSARSQTEEATRRSPRSSSRHLEPQSSDEARTRRRPRDPSRHSRRSATSPSPSASPAIRQARRSNTDLSDRPRLSDASAGRPNNDGRTTSEPTPQPATSMADVVEMTMNRRRPPPLPPREQGHLVAELAGTSSPVELSAADRPHLRSTSQSSNPPPSPRISSAPSAPVAPATPSTAPPTQPAAAQLEVQPGLLPALPPSPTVAQHSSAIERALTLSATSRPTSSSSAGSHRVNLPRYPEPSIICNRCQKTHIEYDLHYSCSYCHNGNYNLCLSCYRTGKGCLHWFGFGYAAFTKFEKLRQMGQLPPNAEKPHMLYAERYAPPKVIPGGAEGRRTLTTEDPARRLQSGAFCVGCQAWANDCYWRCEACHEGDWGFCNNCVNKGQCCTHPLLPLVYMPKNSTTAEATGAITSPVYDHPPPLTASVIEGPGVLELGSFKPLSFRVLCDNCHRPITPEQRRFHCYQCTSSHGPSGGAEGDYDLCVSCYQGLVTKRRVSAENGHQGWRRCLRGHRMVILGFEEWRGGQRRVVVQDSVGGWTLITEPAVGPQIHTGELEKWSWGPAGSKFRLVTREVGAIAPMYGLRENANAQPDIGFPPDGGSGMKAVALWSWWPSEKEGEGDGELLFPRGAEVRECIDVNGDWFFGSYMGKKGLFPAPYVRVVDVGV